MDTVMKDHHVKNYKVRALSSQFSYIIVMINMKLLAVVKTVYSIKEQWCSKWKIVLRENRANRGSKILELVI